jgi:hypothetical protein
MKEATAPKIDVAKISDGLMKVKVNSGKGFFKIGVEKKQGEANSIFLEINGSRKFEIGNDCDTCHFWFKCMQEPRLSPQKKIVNIPKTVHLQRPVDEALVQELSPVLELMEKGEYEMFETSVHLSGPYDSEDEGSYFYNNEFHELWDISDPREEDLLSGWEHYEGDRPRIFRHTEQNNLLEKQFEFIIPLVPRKALKEEHIKVYQDMIKQGDRPRIMLLGMYQRGIPESVKRGQASKLHSFLAGFVLDGHHKLAAYRRSGVPAKFLVILSNKASKYFLLKDEGTVARAKFEERLGALAV